MIYIICEKHSLAEFIYESLNQFGIQNICCFSIITTFFWSEQSESYGPYWVRIPKNMTFNDIPYYTKPDLILKKKYKSFLINESGIVRNELNINFTNNEVIYVNDNKGTNQSLVFDQLCKYKGIPSSISFMNLTSLCSIEVLNSFKNRTPFHFCKTNYMLAYTNTIFDASFFLNGIVLFEQFKFNNSLKISKEHIYCLFAIKEKKLSYQNRISNTLDDIIVNGTGKYPPCSLPIIYDYQSFNNIPQKYFFINELIRELKDAGLLLINNQSTELTEKGHFFLNSLHPNCYDPDIFGRIIEWSHLSINEIDEKISQYIKRYFGRQKRFQSKQFNNKHF